MDKKRIIDLTGQVISNRPFTDILRSNTLLFHLNDHKELATGIILLICGPPGIGKTTLGLALLETIGVPLHAPCPPPLQ